MGPKATLKSLKASEMVISAIKPDHLSLFSRTHVVYGLWGSTTTPHPHKVNLKGGGASRISQAPEQSLWDHSTAETLLESPK